MFGLNRWIEDSFKHYLHRKKEKIINNRILAFEKAHPGVQLITLRKKLANETTRIYPIVDRSILRDRIRRADYLFWITAAASVIFIGSMGGFFSKSMMPFISPIVTSFVAWAGSIVTIPISYNQRVKGAMDSVVAVYEEELNQQTNHFSELKIDTDRESAQVFLSTAAQLSKSSLHYSPSHSSEIQYDQLIDVEPEQVRGYEIDPQVIVTRQPEVGVQSMIHSENNLLADQLQRINII